MKKYLIIALISIILSSLAVYTVFAVRNAGEAEKEMKNSVLGAKEPVELKVDGAILTKAQYDTLKTDLAKKINGDAIDKITLVELQKIEDLVKLQSKKCANMPINGKLDWAAIKKILELNC